MNRLAQSLFLPAPPVACPVGFAGARTGGVGGVYSVARVFSAGGVYSASGVYSTVSARAASFTYPAAGVEFIGHAVPRIASALGRARLEVPASIYQSLAGEIIRSPQGRRSRELAWRQANTDYLRRAFLGQWVVLEGARIIASGPDPVEVVKTARRLGIRSPYIFRVEGRVRPRTSSLGL